MYLCRGVSIILTSALVFTQIAFTTVLTNSSTAEVVRSHARHLPAKRDTDCGTWTIYCGGVPLASGGRGSSAEGACNNACYYTNVVNTNFRARYRSDVDSGGNRIQSGCQTQQGSVCNKIPFSQRFHDPFERVIADYQFNCDEFPMASMDQPAFDPSSGIRNSLRCIKALENEAAGQQFSAFVQGIGNGLAGRTCNGPLPDDATFAIDYNYDNADVSRLGFCQNLPGTADPDPQFQFYLTALGGGQSGRITFPYRPSEDDNVNKYAVATSGKNVLQCIADVVRNADTNDYRVTLLDPDDNPHYAQGNLQQDQDMLTVPAPEGLRPLTIIATGPVGDKGTVGSELRFIYGEQQDSLIPGTDFAWTSLSKGTDPVVSDEFANTLPGGYCVVGNISEDSGLQDVQCYFPCNAA